jgi:hypothetical protein
MATSWRTPAVVIVCGCLIAAVAFGPRSALGFFSRRCRVPTIGAATSLLLRWRAKSPLGMAQPVAGAIADRFGAVRVLSAGAILYALGLVLMAHSTSAAMLGSPAAAR